MSHKISLDLKQKLFEALQKTVQDQAASNQPMESSLSVEPPPPDAGTQAAASEFQKLVQQMRALDETNTDGLYQETEPLSDKASALSPPELPNVSGPTPAEETDGALDILFPWSSSETVPALEKEIPMPYTQGTLSDEISLTPLEDTLERTWDADDPAETEAVLWHLETPTEAGKPASMYDLVEAMEPEEPLLLDDELREASERLARHLEEVERDLAALSQDPLSQSQQATITPELYQASANYDYTAIYEDSPSQILPGETPSAPRVMQSQPNQETFPAKSSEDLEEGSKKISAKTDFNATLSMRSSGSQEESLPPPLSEPPPSFRQEAVEEHDSMLKETRTKGGNMADLSGYKDLSKAPLTLGEQKNDGMTSVLSGPAPSRIHEQSFSLTTETFLNETSNSPAEIDTDVNSNFQTLIRLINELPEGVTKQTGAQIIRLTMESMGIFMEDVLSDAQAAQSEMLDAVRANIKKIEEYKTIIRKLETDIKYYQTKANELSEIIDLFILSNTSSKAPNVDEYTTR